MSKKPKKLYVVLTRRFTDVNSKVTGVFSTMDKAIAYVEKDNREAATAFGYATECRDGMWWYKYGVAWIQETTLKW